MDVKYCPCCGNRVTEPVPTKLHQHYFCIDCSKCGQVSNIWLKSEIDISETNIQT